jgi:hypothetical protein
LESVAVSSILRGFFFGDESEEVAADFSLDFSLDFFSKEDLSDFWEDCLAPDFFFNFLRFFAGSNSLKIRWISYFST